MFQEFDADTVLEHIEIARSSGYVFAIFPCSHPPRTKISWFSIQLIFLMALGSSRGSQAPEEVDPASLMI
jgi:hypothetical protein